MWEYFSSSTDLNHTAYFEVWFTNMKPFNGVSSKNSKKKKYAISNDQLNDHSRKTRNI